MTILLVEMTRQGSLRADEHDRTRAAIRPVDVGDGGSVGMGVVSVSTLWQQTDRQARQLLSQAEEVVGWAPQSKGSATPVSRVWEDLFGDSALVGARELVCARSASLCGGPLGVWWVFVSADSDHVAIMDGEARAMAAVACCGQQG